MPALHEIRLRLRLLALLVVLVAFDVVAVAAAYVLAHVAAGLAPLLGYQYEHLFWSLSFDIVPLWPVLVVGTPIVLACQSLFGYRLTLQETQTEGVPDPEPDTTDEMRAQIERHETTQQLRSRVGRLAQLADMSPPEVTIVDSTTPNSYICSRPGEQTLVATTALLETLDGAELDAVLAHELAHLKNGDAFVMTAAAFLPTVSRRFLTLLSAPIRRSSVARRVLDTDADTDDSSGGLWSTPQFGVVLVLFALVALPMTGVLYLASTACYRLLSRIREYAADAGGVAICGSPAALASALEALTATPRPETDLRTAAVGVRELCVVPHALAEGQPDPPETRAERLRHWARTQMERLLPDSHPATEARIAALRQHHADQQTER